MVKKCFICQIERPNKARSCTDLVTFSGKSILDIVIETLAVKDVEHDAMTCQLCFEVVDEIDAFEQSLKKSKEKLRVKYQVKYERDALQDFSNGNDDILPLDQDCQNSIVHNLTLFINEQFWPVTLKLKNFGFVEIPCNNMYIRVENRLLH